MTTRQQFLATVAARLENGLPENPIRPLLHVPNQPLEYAVDLSDPTGWFVAAAGAAGAEIVETTAAELPATILDLVRTLGVDPTVAVSGASMCRPVAEHLMTHGVRLADDLAPAALSGTALGITGARAGIAVTGSIVVDSSVPGERAVSLLPDIHLAILRSADIVPDPGSILRALNTETLPSNLVFVTGPSRSADIELQLTIGVHGPGRLIIALI